MDRQEPCLIPPDAKSRDRQVERETQEHGNTSKILVTRGLAKDPLKKLTNRQSRNWQQPIENTISCIYT